MCLGASLEFQDYTNYLSQKGAKHMVINIVFKCGP